MATNLTDQVRNIAEVTTAVANGDLSQTDHGRRAGRDPRAQADDQHDGRPALVASPTRSRASRARSAPRASSAARPRSRASRGTWRDLTESVNFLAGNLTDQVRNIAAGHDRGRQRRPVAEDHRRRAGRDPRAQEHDQHDGRPALARSPTRSRASRARSAPRASSAARRAVEGVSGTWRGLTDNVNLMATNLTDQVRNIAAGHDRGRQRRPDAEDHRRRARRDRSSCKDTINTMVDQLRAFAAEVTRVAREVGTEGKLGGQAEVEGVSGTWRGLTENVNLMATNLTDQVRNIAQVTTAVANGDLTQKITVDAQGEIAELKDTINTMVDQLSSLRRRGHARRARGRHRGHARRPGRGQGRLRHVARPDRERQPAREQPHRARCATSPRSTTAVAHGDLSQKITVDARGEILELKRHDQHDGRPALVVRRRGHARGARGRHRGQARRPGRGRGRVGHLARPDRERQPARRRTSPRRCARSPTSSTAVTQGDLTRQITVEASGEVAELQGPHQPDDRQPARHDAAERRAGLAEDEPRADLEPDAGPARPRRPSRG